jgi:hypothetical protein
MFYNIPLFFTNDQLFSYEPIHLILGISIGIVAVVAIIKKIINRKK